MRQEFNLNKIDIENISSIVKKERRTLTAGEITKIFYEEHIKTKNIIRTTDEAIKIKKIILKQFTERLTKKLNTYNVFRKKRQNKQIFVYFSI